MLVLSGRVQDGKNEAHFWMNKYSEQYSELCQMAIYPGSLNLLSVESIRLSDYPRDLIIVYPNQFPELSRTILIKPCILRFNSLERRGFIWRTTNGERLDSNLLEIISDIKLRDFFPLENGDDVEVEILSIEKFFNVKEIIEPDGDLKLSLSKCSLEDPDMDIIPDHYLFKMVNKNSGETMGQIDLRIKYVDLFYLYGGMVGYLVNKNCRGNRYAARSLKLVLHLAKKHGLNPFIVTCTPDNVASRKTCEIVGGEFIEIVNIPKNTTLYFQGYRKVCRYSFKLEDITIDETMFNYS